MSKVAKEVAEADFNRFGAAMDLNFDISQTDRDSLEGFNGQKQKVVDALMKGSLVINEFGEPEYTPQRIDNIAGGKIVFHEPTGAAYMEMDRCKEAEGMKKTFVFMAATTGISSSTFATMPNRDIKVCQAITALFLA